MVYGVAFSVVILGVAMVAYFVEGDVGLAVGAGVIAVFAFPWNGFEALLVAKIIHCPLSWCRKHLELRGAIVIRIQRNQEAEYTYYRALTKAQESQRIAAAKAEQERAVIARERAPGARTCSGDAGNSEAGSGTGEGRAANRRDAMAGAT